MSDFDPECGGEFIDGVWSGCGCGECGQAEYDAIEADVETGSITEDEARERHALNGD
jgi:hypothetical protein